MNHGCPSVMTARARCARLSFALAVLSGAFGGEMIAAGAPLHQANEPGAGAPLMAGAPCHPAWEPFGAGGMNQMVRALAAFDDGAGGGVALYAGGQFTTSDGAVTNGIAKWTGSSWSPLGSGAAGPGALLGVRALAVFDDGSGGGPALYAGGQFTTIGGVVADGIAKWNGSAWSPVGNGQMSPPNSVVNALAIYDDGSGGGPALYAGGSFTTVGGVAAARIAKWNGSTWSPLSSGTNSGVHSLAVFDDGSGGGPALFASGIFSRAGDLVAIYSAKWDGTSWSALGSGTVGLGVYSMTVFDDGGGGGPALYLGGEFASAGDVPASRIARWNGTTWTPVGGGVDAGVYSLATFDDGTGGGASLYAGGFFSSAGGAPASGVAKWDGTAWTALGSGVAGGVFALMGFETVGDAAPALYVGGTFQTAQGFPSKYVAKWQGCPVDGCLAADLNCDGVVDGADLGLLLGSWGACAGCPADLNGDGAVDGADLGMLLGAWTA